jgi:hypothetical protein
MEIIKIIIRLALEKITEIKGWFFIRSRARHSIIFSRIINHQKVLDLISIAYNKDSLIKLQSKLLKKFVTDEITYHVVDNSTNQNTSNLLADFCRKNYINYYKLTTNPSNRPSRSHGHALNWALHHIAAKSNNFYYGFLDHDIFPIKKTSIISKLKNQGFYGHQQKRGELVYLWPGFCFFDKKKVNPKDLNFLPKPFLGLDTGGRFYKNIKEVSTKEIKWPKHSYIKVNNLYESVHDSCVEKLDDWIHLINGSGWKKTDKKKHNLALNYIRKFQNS